MTQAHLAVSEVFGPTFQGEGPSLGQRSAFVRLARCNLDCRWCDTPFTWDWSRFDPAEEVRSLAVDDIVAALDDLAPGRVVVTGGEPLLQQQRLVDLLRGCVDRGWPVEVETNGTVVPGPEIVALVERFNVSPKLANSGVAEDRRIRPDALHALTHSGRAVFKFVVGDATELDEVQALADTYRLTPVWIMPEGTTADAVLAGMRTLADPVLARGWHLTTRLHVLLWGDERGR